MLQSIRDHAKGWLAWVIVGLISVPFALWGINEYINPSRKAVVAEVNGTEIPRQVYQDAYQRQLMRLRQRFQGQTLDWTPFEQQLKKSVLDRLVDEELLRQAADQQRMRIGDQQLVQHLHGIDYFHEEGRFSQARYEMMLRSQGMVPRGFEEEMRRGLLTAQLQEGVLNSGFMTDFEQYQRARINDQQRLIAFVTIPAKSYQTKVEVDDAEIQAHYDQHGDDYKTQEKVKIAYIELSLDSLREGVNQPEEAVLEERYQRDQARYTQGQRWRARQILIQGEGDDARQKAADLVVQARAGENFAGLAKQHSADPVTAKEGGDMGWISEGEQRKPLEDALASLESGAVSDPVQTEFGWHVLKLEEMQPASTKPFAEVREEILQEYYAEESESRFYALHEQFANLAFEQQDNLHVLSETLSLPIQQSDWFTRDGGESGILKERKVVDTAFTPAVLRNRMNSEMIELDDKHLVLLRLQEHDPSVARPLEEVKDRIRETLSEQKAQAMAKTTGEALLAAIKTQSDWSAVAEQHGVQWESPRWVKRMDGKIKPAEILHEAFKMGDPGEQQGLAHGFALSSGDWALVAVFGVRYPNRESEPAMADASRNYQQRMLGENEYQAYLAGLKQAAEIKTFPEEL